ncbi:MAG: transporter substrate-binding domain-containing protein [Butyrivibrio sp.]|nr:transporter substrate-binding domain-containing protein [Butyrivibrio sp.]
MRKNILITILAAASAFSLVACGAESTGTDAASSAPAANEATATTEGADIAQNTDSAEDHLARVKAAGKITVATEGVWAPFTYHDEKTDALVGFDVEVAKAIAEKLGVEAEFQEVAFDGGLTGVATGTFDMMANGVGVTEERKETYDFTDPYVYDHSVIVTLASNESINSFEDLNGRTTANSAGSTYESLGIANGATVSNVDTIGETMTLVLNGTVDATINSMTTAQDYINTTGTTKLRIAAVAEDATLCAIPLKKGADNDTLREAINKAIAELRADGTLTEISNKYFGADITAE